MHVCKLLSVELRSNDIETVCDGGNVQSPSTHQQRDSTLLPNHFFVSPFLLLASPEPGTLLVCVYDNPAIETVVFKRQVKYYFLKLAFNHSPFY